MLEIHAKLDLAQLRAAADQALRALQGQGDANHPVRVGWRHVARLYRSFAQRRFSAAARGDGTWKPLAKSTLKRRFYAPVARARRFERDGFETDPARQAKRLRAARAKARKTEKAFAAGKYKVAILIDTGTLRSALDPEFHGLPGQLQQEIPFGIRVGYGGPHAHPEGKGVTVADVAMFHDQGGPNGRPPKRSIIVPPDDRTVQRMAAVLRDKLMEAMGGEAAAG